jgi:hypothetical protein
VGALDHQIGQAGHLDAHPVQHVPEPIPQLAKDGAHAADFTVSPLTATTLTLNGTPLSALTLDAGARIVAVSPWFATSIPAGSGNSSTAAEKWILSSSNSAAERVLDRKLGPTQMVIAAMDD